ncbi:hypothetical protein ACP275_10G126000 [Erythranthe tilingii]
MEYAYGECLKSQSHIAGKTDGCQKFVEGWDPISCSPSNCAICGCHQLFHRKVEPPVQFGKEVVYTKCHKIHEFKFQNSVDGCQEFAPGSSKHKKSSTEGLTCTVCGCHRSFHEKEIITRTC